MEKKEKYIFEKLTPISDGELGIYEDAFNFIFQNNDLRNVAISGAYGAGKSSILSSYKSKHTGKKYIHISLAHFSESNDVGEEALIKESVLEGKILNQLIHQIPAEKIPQTNFRTKKDINIRQLVSDSVVLFLFILSGIMLVFFNKWAMFVNSLDIEKLKTVLGYTITDKFHVVVGILFATLFFMFVYKAVEMQKNRNIFRKLSFQGNEIEIFEETEDSYFDKYLNEVLYLFESVEEDVIVFEDIDRFDTNQIFERLREINTLANLQREKSKKKIIRFFYLLRDDIFFTKDRTKFFDFIIPIVPVVDSSNSYSQFISHLAKNNLSDEFDERFLQGLSLYIDDMRLLKNICNEFLIYYNRINITELNYNKMLALIVYKNLFPKDYGDLQLNQGFVYALFAHKSEFIQSERDALQKEIEENQKEIDELHKESLESLQDLEDVSDSKQRRSNYSISKQREYDEWKKVEYPKRKRAIENKNSNAQLELEERILKLNRRLNILNELPLCQIISRENINAIFSLTTKNEIGTPNLYNDIKESAYFDLLKYLIRNGYIDESYADYMTYFYEGTLSRVDKIFLRSVTDKKAKDYTYKLEKPNMVYQRLRPIDFDQEETLNNTLIDYLFTYGQDSEQLYHLIDQLKNSKKYDFIEQYFDVTSSIQRFINIFNTTWPEFFSEILQGRKISEDHIRKFSIYSLYYSDDKTIQEININGVLSDYISGANDYLKINAPDIERLIHGFSILNIFFPNIDYDVSNSELFDAVYENGQYIINNQNIELILLKKYKISNREDIKHKAATLVFGDANTPLSRKIHEDMPTFLDVILNNCSGKITDDESIAIKLLNDATITQDAKEKYIEYLQTVIEELSTIQEKRLWSNLIAKNIVELSEKNILNYYLYVGEIDDIAVNFMNTATYRLDFSKLDSSYNEQKQKIFTDFVMCNDLNDEQYRSAVTSLNRYYPEFGREGISNSKMRILIDEMIVRMNEESLTFMRKNYPKVLLYYIKSNIDEYTEIINETLFSQNELMDILLIDVDVNKKLKLLTLSKESISIVDKKYPVSVCQFILQNNLFNDDLPVLYKTYSKYAAEIRKIVLEYSIQNIADIIASSEDIDRKLKEDIMKSEIDTENKIELLLADFQNLNQGAISNYLHIVGKEDFKKIFDSSTRPRFDDNDTNRRLLQEFINRKWIHDYYCEGDYLKIRRTKPKMNDN